ncbi:FAD-dependent oxidoreductase [uncultured Paracoccus sp.]|uniref:NAD(P)/FAD-dependent oxidoreductase n=1 Tax=Escherichia coli TaxID=562 RepID=UPI0026056CE7|nr:FAD-dependent oxidoreductase [uncultured Paracoccus sp.]
MTVDPDVVVIGGGVIGSAISLGLAMRGKRVTVLDGADIAHRASRGNFSLIWVQSKGLGMPGYADWARKAALSWPVFAEQLERLSGVDLAFIQPGGLHLTLSEGELEARKRVFIRLREQCGGVDPYPWEILDAAQVKRMLPEVGPTVTGASYCPLDGQANSLRLLRALHIGGNRSNVSYRPLHIVTTIEHRGGEFVIKTDKGTFTAGKVVLTAGHDNARLGPMVGLDVPVRPQKGEILVTEKVRPFLYYPTINVRQTDEGGVQLGDSVEETGFDDTVDLRVLSAIAGRITKMFPLLENVNIVRTWGALRVMPRDGKPIYDQSKTCPGAFVATAHSGVSMASVHMLEVPRMIAAGALDAELSCFTSERFQ